MRRDLYGQFLSNVLSRPSAGNSIPKRTNIGGQEHLLAYITPEESFTLRRQGGGVPPGGGQYIVNGVPAFPEPDINDPGVGIETFGDIGNPQAQAMADVEADIASQAQAQALADIDAQIHQQQIQNQAVQAAGQHDPGLDPESGAIMEAPPLYYTGVNMPSGDVVPDPFSDDIGLYAGDLTAEDESAGLYAGAVHVDDEDAINTAITNIKNGRGFYASLNLASNHFQNARGMSKEDANNVVLDAVQDALGKTFVGFYPAIGANLAEMAFRSGLSVEDPTMALPDDAEGMGPSDQEMAQYILAQKPQGSTDAQEDAQEVQRVFSEVPPDIAARLDRNIRGVPSGENENRLALLRTLLNQRNLLG
jgi:hypothetical protein